MAYETIGNEEFTKRKVFYLIFILAVYGFLFLCTLGATAGGKDALYFYIWFGAILGLLPFIIDLLVRNKELPIDSLSIENNNPIRILNNVWVQIVLSVVLAIILGIYIKTTGQAFLKSPDINIELPLLSNFPSATKIFDAIVRATASGIVESIVMWGAIFPTLFALTSRAGVGRLASAVVSILLTAIIFTVFHWAVYGYMITALLMVFLFGVIQGVLAYVFRSLLPLFTTHIANNLCVNLFVMAIYTVQVAV